MPWPLQGGCCGRVVAGQPLHVTQVDEGFALAAPVAKVAVQLQRLLVAGCGGPVIAGQLLYLAEVVEGFGLASLVTGLRNSSSACRWQAGAAR